MQSACEPQFSRCSESELECRGASPRCLRHLWPSNRACALGCKKPNARTYDHSGCCATIPSTGPTSGQDHIPEFAVPFQELIRSDHWSDISVFVVGSFSNAKIGK